MGRFVPYQETTNTGAFDLSLVPSDIRCAFMVFTVLLPKHSVPRIRVSVTPACIPTKQCDNTRTRKQRYVDVLYSVFVGYLVLCSCRLSRLKLICLLVILFASARSLSKRWELSCTRSFAWLSLPRNLALSSLVCKAVGCL